MLKRLYSSIACFVLIVSAAPCNAGYSVSARVSFGVARFSPVNPIGDFDGDGRLDVVLIFPGSPAVARIYDAMSASNSDFEAEVPLPELPCCSPSVATAMNLDEDELLEIVAFSYSSEEEHGGYVVIDFMETMGAASPSGSVMAHSTSIRPNPSNPSATIDYFVPRKGTASIQMTSRAGSCAVSLVVRSSPESGPSRGTVVTTPGSSSPRGPTSIP